MIRHQAIDLTRPEEIPLEDRSMRVIEYTVAFVAIVVAGILALVR
jgi:hypothetical protein